MMYTRTPLFALLTIMLLSMMVSTTVSAQTGVSDDRVSLPEGPGSLEGVGENVEMDPNMGNMRYSVPINVPQGFGAVTPSLSLSYSSGGGSGVVGMGWSFNTPFIERMTYRGLPEYGLADDFSANGSDQLVLLPGSNPPVYRARYEKGFVRYSWMQAGEGAEGYWLAEYPDGSKGYFGAREDGELVAEARMGQSDGTFRYMLVEKVDKYGHKMTMEYQKFGVVPLPVSIAYAFEADADGAYTIGLTYEERRDGGGFDYVSDAKPGFDELLTQRLQRIDISARGTRIRSYQLSYAPYDESGGFTMLTRVEEIGLEGGVYPRAFAFDYSQTLGATGNTPSVIPMGSLGISLAAGRATLLDINGDALPDIIDTSESGPHRFFINEPDMDGSSQFNTTPASSQIAAATGANFTMGRSNPGVQVLDADGDGFADLLNATTGDILFNKGTGDWSNGSISGVSGIGSELESDFDFDSGGLQALRFMDYNNDKRIDLMRANSQGTSFFENIGENGFEVVSNVESLGASFEQDNAQLTDMNGDGLLDVAILTATQLRYKLNYGFGNWGPFVAIDGLPLSEAVVNLAELEDINGDGLADLVVVSGPTITYALNKNGAEFAGAEEIDTNDVAGDLPSRTDDMTVLYADMNANGSTDIVYIDGSGDVNALELFPVRPNLLTKIENNLGQVTEISYGSSVQQQALDRADGLPEWQYKLPHPMLLVTQVDRYELLTGEADGGGIHEITSYRYHDGFYDGFEKQFRGYGRVESFLAGDDSQEGGRNEQLYDVGAPRDGGGSQDSGPYFNGLLLSDRSFTGDRMLSESTTSYSDCALDGIPNGTELPVKFICPTEVTTVIQEGAAASEHITTRDTSSYDGYGNVTESIQHGVVSIGGGSCEPCGGRGPDEFGVPCGDTCVGDEIITRTEYVEPGDDTSGLWILGLPFREQAFGRDGSTLTSESLTYYDGADFVGLPLGQLTLGNVTRTTQKKEVGSGDVIELVRNRFDAHGNIVEIIDPLGSPDGPDHRSLYAYDADQLRVIRAELLNQDSEGNPYLLRRDVTYEPFFDKIVDGTEWMRVVDGQVVSTRRSTSYIYDEFGRMIQKVVPGGDTALSPTETYAYNLGSPVSSIVIRRRSAVGGSLDLEVVNCFDGRGRQTQSRTLIEDGQYQVSGFVAFNVRNAPVRTYQPYTSTSALCDMSEPSDALATTFRYDAAYRTLEETQPDGDIYNGASVKRFVYAPLTVMAYDFEDTDQNSPYSDTPTITRMDGLGRAVQVERLLGPNNSEITELHYDSLGRLTGYTDPGGNRKDQSYDLLNRVTEIIDPNSTNSTTYQYDDASNVIRSEDDRGVVTLSAYDGLNRQVATWDEADPDGSRITMSYDFDPGCDRAKCTHTEGRLVTTTYPGLSGETTVENAGYDLRGRNIYASRQLDGFPFEFQFGYDNADRITSVTYPNGRVITRSYDGQNNLTAIDGIVSEVLYDDRSQLNSMTFADGSSQTINYDDIMRITDMVVTGGADGVLQGFGYSRDRNGNLTSIQDLGDDRAGKIDFTANFTYDAWYRVTESAQGGETVNFEFDAIDNLTAATSSDAASPANAGSYSYGYSVGGNTVGPNAVTSVGDQTFGYDEAGHMNTRNGQAMTWDFMGRMTGVTAGDAEIGRYTYGANQSRVAKQEGDSTVLYASRNFEVRDGISTIYVLARDNTRVARIEDESLATSLLSDLNSDSAINAADAWLANMGGGESSTPGALLMSAVRHLLVETGPADKTTFLHSDHLSSITLATAAEGDNTVVLGERSFHPLGTVQAEAGYVDEYGFTGQEIDRATGLIHFDWRYYDPTVGRWLAIDPKFAKATLGGMGSFGQSTTAYNYVAGNFANFSDPTGLEGGKKAQNPVQKAKQAKRAAKKKKYGAKNPLKPVYGQPQMPKRKKQWRKGFGKAKNVLKPVYKQKQQQKADIKLIAPPMMSDAMKKAKQIQVNNDAILALELQNNQVDLKLSSTLGGPTPGGPNGASNDAVIAANWQVNIIEINMMTKGQLPMKDFKTPGGPGQVKENLAAEGQSDQGN